MATRTLSLTKHGHRYLFRYSTGYEDEVVDEIMRLADDPESDLNWVDAAALSFQVTQYAADDCLEAIKGENQPPQ